MSVASGSSQAAHAGFGYYPFAQYSTVEVPSLKLDEDVDLKAEWERRLKITYALKTLQPTDPEYHAQLSALTAKFANTNFILRCAAVSTANLAKMIASRKGRTSLYHDHYQSGSFVEPTFEEGDVLMQTLTADLPPVGGDKYRDWTKKALSEILTSHRLHASLPSPHNVSDARLLGAIAVAKMIKGSPGKMYSWWQLETASFPQTIAHSAYRRLFSERKKANAFLTSLRDVLPPSSAQAGDPHHGVWKILDDVEGAETRAGEQESPDRASAAGKRRYMETMYGASDYWPGEKVNPASRKNGEDYQATSIVEDGKLSEAMREYGDVVLLLDGYSSWQGRSRTEETLGDLMQYARTAECGTFFEQARAEQARPRVEPERATDAQALAKETDQQRIRSEMSLSNILSR